MGLAKRFMKKDITVKTVIEKEEKKSQEKLRLLTSTAQEEKTSPVFDLG